MCPRTIKPETKASCVCLFPIAKNRLEDTLPGNSAIKFQNVSQLKRAHVAQIEIEKQPQRAGEDITVQTWFNISSVNRGWKLTNDQVKHLTEADVFHRHLSTFRLKSWQNRPQNNRCWASLLYSYPLNVNHGIVSVQGPIKMMIISNQEYSRKLKLEYWMNKHDYSYYSEVTIAYCPQT